MKALAERDSYICHSALAGQTETDMYGQNTNKTEVLLNMLQMVLTISFKKMTFFCPSWLMFHQRSQIN